MEKKNRFNYGWVNVICGFIIMALAWTITFNLPSVFIPTWAEDFGFSRSALNFSFTIRSITQFLASLTAAYIFKRFKIKNVMKVSSIVLTLATFGISSFTNLGQLYFCFALMGVSTILITIIPLSIILTNWFDDNLGLVTGITFMGSGVGTAILSPLMGYILSNYSWRSGYLLLTALLALVLVPIIFFFLKEEPDQLDYEDGEEIRSQVRGVELADLRDQGKFHLLVISVLVMGLGASALMTHVSPQLEDVGYSVQFASNIYSLASIALAFGKLFLGFMFDKAGVRLASTTSSLAIASGLLSLAWVSKSEILLLGVILGTGYGCSFGTVANQNIIKNLFGTKNYGEILSILQAANGLGSMISPLITGFLYDYFGQYNQALIIIGILAGLTLFAFDLIMPSKAGEKYRAS